MSLQAFSTILVKRSPDARPMLLLEYNLFSFLSKPTFGKRYEPLVGLQLTHRE